MNEIRYAMYEDDEVWTRSDPYECIEELISDMCPLDITVGMVVSIYQGEATPAKLNTNIDFVDILFDYNEDSNENAVDDILGKLRDLNLNQYLSDQIEKFMKNNNVTFNLKDIVNIKPLYYKVVKIESLMTFVLTWEECDEATFKKYLEFSETV